MEPLSGLDATFLAMETQTSRLHVAGILVLEPPDDDASAIRATDAAASRFDAIRTVVGERVGRVPRLLRRAVRVPLGVQRPVWVDQAEIDLDAHVHAAAVDAPGGQRELDALIGKVLSRPLPVDQPLWEMVVAEGLAGGRTAVIARLHHAILDGVSGATAMAAFLDLTPGSDDGSGTGNHSEEAAPTGTETAAVNPKPTNGAGLPNPLGLWRYAVSSLARQPEAAAALAQRTTDLLVALTRHNRELAMKGLSPPPTPFSAPHTSLNGRVTGVRHVATFGVPLDDLEFVRRAVGPELSTGSRGATVNDVILTAVGGALRHYLEEAGENPRRPLVALVPVSTRGPASVPASGRAHVGNYVSGMLVPLATTEEDPVARLRAVANASAIAKMQEDVAGGEFLETLLQAVPPILVSGLMRAASRFSLFDRVAPPANVVVSSIVVPDVSLWWAGRQVSAIYPTGPVADGVGLNVTSMTYKGTVHFGIVGCPRLVPDVDKVAALLDDAIAELMSAALETST
jgi:diacylglycerol O-acyltransferase